jgi:hypothetical protein
MIRNSLINSTNPSPYPKDSLSVIQDSRIKIPGRNRDDMKHTISGIGAWERLSASLNIGGSSNRQSMISSMHLKPEPGSPEYRMVIALAGNNCTLKMDQLKSMLGAQIYHQGLATCLANRWILQSKASGQIFLDRHLNLVTIPPFDNMDVYQVQQQEYNNQQSLLLSQMNRNAKKDNTPTPTPPTNYAAEDTNNTKNNNTSQNDESRKLLLSFHNNSSSSSTALHKLSRVL